MRAIVQHNLSSGFGDCVVSIFEYLNTVKKLIKRGYKVKLIINLVRNFYFEKNLFFDFFNKNEFNDFYEIEVTLNPIDTVEYENLTRVYTLSGANPGGHWWDLFLENGYDEKILNEIEIYPYGATVFPEEKHIFNKEITDEYQSLIKDKLLNSEYISVYYRSLDYQDNEDFLDKNKKIICELFENKKVFVCSNSFLFKKWVKECGFDNVFMFDIPNEDIYGNHTQPGIHLKNQDDLSIRTKFTIFDMIALGSSKEIHQFTAWGRTSNFTFLGKLNGAKINLYY